MPHLFEILDRADYERAVDGGYIRVQAHPSLPYLIHNYSDSCTWDQAWTPATRACRGLVTHADTGEVLARPFPKFFNHGQPGAPALGLDDPVLVTEKMDGSCGILYPVPGGGHAIATRGSFVSDQAQWATALWADRYAHAFDPDPRWTYVFEVIAPWNRIVVDYGDTEDIVLLGAVEIASGRSVRWDQATAGWPGPVVGVHPHATLREALAAPERSNAEGFVVHHPESDVRVKIKHEEYKALHRWLTNTTERHVWEVLADGRDPGQVFAGAPDEFHEWLRGVVHGLRAQHAAQKENALAAYQGALASLPTGFSRREFAERVSQEPQRPLLFLLLDGKPVDEPIWRSLKPAGSSVVRAVSHDAD